MARSDVIPAQAGTAPAVTTTPPDLDPFTTHWRAARRLPMWTIHRKPSDYPDGWVARMCLTLPPPDHPQGKVFVPEVTGNAIFGPTLAAVRAALPAGRTRPFGCADHRGDLAVSRPADLARQRARGIALMGGAAFDWPPGIDTATQVAVVQLMLLAQNLAASGHGDLVVTATAHALDAGGWTGGDEG